MTDTPNLALPYLLAAQSQKHVTHNEAVRALDALVQISVLDRNLAVPPASPSEGDRYIIAAAPTGAWVGQTGKIAAFQDGAWLFYAPRKGWLAWIADETTEAVYDGAAWIPMAGGVSDHGALTGLTDDDHPQYLTNARGDARYTPLDPMTLGINATADATNKLAVGSAASLFNHPGTGGHQIKINKAAATDTASFLFQTAFSGRAELGTAGDDDFHFKVSANGSTWTEAININRTTGVCTFPNTTLGTGTVTSVGTGTGLTGGPIVGAGTISLANMAGNSLKGNNTGAPAAPADLTAAQVKTLLAIAASDVSGLAAIATSGSANDLTAGTVPSAQMPAMTGDVTSAAGSVALTIANNAVSNAKAAQMAANTIKGNATGATANAADLTTAQTTAMLDAVVGDAGSGGTKGLAPAPAAGDAAAGKFLKADGTWALPPSASGVPDGDKGDITVTGGVWTIDANVVTNGDLAQMPASTIKGNNTGATANAADLSGAQVQALLVAQPTVQVFTASGTWTKPAGCKRVRVRVVGGGGGGGGSTAAASALACGSGGGSGAYSEGVFDVTAVSSAAVTVGGGGSAGAAANGTGGAGGASSFGSLITAVGGGSGGIALAAGTAANTVIGGSGGAAGAGGHTNVPGQQGNNSVRGSSAGGASGQGAASVFTGGGLATSIASGGAKAGGNAGGYGCGGGGALSNSATGFAGGAGAAGIVIVEEFY